MLFNYKRNFTYSTLGPFLSGRIILLATVKDVTGNISITVIFSLVPIQNVGYLFKENLKSTEML